MQLGNATYQQFSASVQVLESDLPLPEEAATDKDAVLLTQALRTAQNAPDIRVQKIADIKARIAAGTYKVDALNLAIALVREEPGLFVR